MRPWLWLPVLLLPLGYTALTNFGAPQALASIAAQPLVALTRGEGRFPVQAPGRPAAEGEAVSRGGSGVIFGYRMTYALPSGEVVDCTIRFTTLTCDDGWTAERAEAR